MKSDTEYTLLDYDFSNGKKKLKVVLTYFQGIPKVDIREYYYDEKEECFKHTKKGIQLDSNKAGALRVALENNEKLIDAHLLNEDLEKWAASIKEIKTSADYFNHYEFYKTVSKGGGKDEIIFNGNHPFGKKILSIESRIEGDESLMELMALLKVLLITYDNSLSQFDEASRIYVGDYLQDQSRLWSTLLSRLMIARFQL